MKLLLALVFVTGVTSGAQAQPTPLDRYTPPLSLEDAQKMADILSWGTAITLVTLDTVGSWKAPDRKAAFLKEGGRLGITYTAAFLVKKIVGRDRPCAPPTGGGCGHDDPHASFYSAHTAVAFSVLGCVTQKDLRLGVTVPLATGTGYLRVLADKHWLTDVLAGAGAGWLTSRLC